MPLTPTYPGVYIIEVPSGVRTIVGVATSVAAFVDRFARGPVEVPVRLFSISDLDREFGGLDAQSVASYAIRQFFLNGGTEAHVVRIDTEGDVAASVELGTDIVRLTAGRRVGRDSVADPGEWGNRLRVEVDYATTDPATQFNLIVSLVSEVGGRMVVERTETFRNLTLEDDAPNNALAVVNAGSKLVQLDRDGMPDPPGEDRPPATGTLSGPLPGPPGGGEPVVPDGSTIELVVDPGSGEAAGFSGPALIQYDGAVPQTYAEFRPFLEAAIRAADRNNPLLAGASVQLAGDRFRILLGRSGAGFAPDATITFPNADPDEAATVLALTAGTNATFGDQMAALTDGADGDPPTAEELQGNHEGKTGIYALEDADLFNILCLPAAAELGDTDMRAVYAEAESYCQQRRAVLIIDIPEGVDELTEMETWLSENEGLRHPNAAVYFPRVRMPDPLNRNRLRSVGSSGTIAGLYAATDGSRGVWKAPAGTEARLRNVQGLDYLLTDRENGVLNPLGVNALRNFPVYGNVSWGARTLDGADVQSSDWKYIPVRRLALFLEESLFRGTQWVVFEPNDEPLWAQIRLNIGSFMHNLFRKGAFQGSTPADAYLVKCDHETTTQDDINRGIVNILVGFAPLKPAEFVIIRIQQLAGQIET
jgi:uncharacterized protein